MLKSNTAAAAGVLSERVVLQGHIKKKKKENAEPNVTKLVGTVDHGWRKKPASMNPDQFS